ncbi:16S rRNA (adenine(1518)-N(6)/adenine(1519)-N(6))-dimethyltransferase RsmA [Parvularcula lutaonensis]|uniref:Ribosomal RNA small subunit methyltransferase A n=1 Tax=Parvularcula lutaonensis TaxID=491923 RepID=A0ABV7MFE4_9PROT|nr:16S rRNA (adenine(1518)-N(6)/adenine(1519)-N(6))-dimethyltransferase RsmA [Parvularcula lutaonensis]GGY54542.1 ribosomal RNA small subunit methyltransferase A [Parvularcula lutaonensis]
MSSLETLPALRDVIAEHGLAAKKGLGQHFLLDLNLTRKIAGFCEAEEDDTILEIGPGPGGLTRALLETGARVVAIERDRRIVPVLEALNDATGRLSYVEDDALQSDEAALVPEGAIIASNLPYNISTELLVKWLIAEPRFWRRMVLMFQKEVGDRILAEPGSKTYGRLSVIAQAASRPRLGFHLPARAFTPPPKVDSSVLVFENEGRPEHLRELERVTQAAFSQRRKMLRQSLKPVFGAKLTPVLDDLGIPETARAETVSVPNYARLAARLARA